MATMKALSMRLKSVKNIQKITKSMRMVSAAKYSRAERELRAVRPHGKGTQIFFDKADIAKTEEMKDTKAKHVIIAVTSDKGLCGAVHTMITKAVKNELAYSPGETIVICIGDKSRIQLQHTVYGQNISLVVNEVGRLPPIFLDASKIAVETMKFDFYLGKIIYNKFNSVISYVVSQINLFSKNAILIAAKLQEESIEFDVLDSYMEFSLASLIFYTLKENACSEQASRMTAMQNASKNAGDVINKLTLSSNRTRQAAITCELIEIISGAAALK